MRESPLMRTDQRSPEQNGRRFQPAARVPASDPFAAGELGLITRDVASRTGARTGLLAVRNQTGRLAEVLCAWGAAPGREVLPPLPADCFVGRVLESGLAALEPIDAEQDTSLGVAVSGGRLTWAAGAAVRPPGSPPGALCVGFSVAPEDPALTLWLLEGYARLAAVCRHDAGVLEGLLAAARLDGLTGCLNHAAIHGELGRELARSVRQRRSVSCCFIDLDGFKQVNDRHGHPYGSRVLADVAAILRAGLRDGDTLGRYGGDEFVAILPETDHTAARALAERLRSAIQTTIMADAYGPIDASIGVAQWQPGFSSDGLLEAADRALRAAKAAGGATVISASDYRNRPPDRDAA